MRKSNPFPDPSDRVASLRFRCEHAPLIGYILVTVVNDEQRSTILRTIARRLSAPYIVCGPTRSLRQFLHLLAAGLRLAVPRTTADLWDAVGIRLQAEPRLVILDNAECLPRGALRAVLDLHKSDEHVRLPKGGRASKVAFVLASGSQELLRRVEACGGSFTTHCFFYAPDCEPTKRMRERRERLAPLLAEPTIPFPAEPLDDEPSE